MEGKNNTGRNNEQMELKEDYEDVGNVDVLPTENDLEHENVLF